MDNTTAENNLESFINELVDGGGGVFVLVAPQSGSGIKPFTGSMTFPAGSTWDRDIALNTILEIKNYFETYKRGVVGGENNG
jgi:hypothetical protein